MVFNDLIHSHSFSNLKKGYLTFFREHHNILKARIHPPKRGINGGFFSGGEKGGLTWGCEIWTNYISPLSHTWKWKEIAFLVKSFFSLHFSASFPTYPILSECDMGVNPSIAETADLLLACSLRVFLGTTVSCLVLISEFLRPKLYCWLFYVNHLKYKAIFTGRYF